MRGKDKNDDFGVQQIGITPAYAGKRNTIPYMVKVFRDHPRLCGEKVFPAVEKLLMLGSPPPMRGKVYTSLYIWVSGGITPAYAGKSFLFACLMMLTKDHPRLCGEKGYSVYQIGNATGSPPPMRGKASWSGSWWGTPKGSPPPMRGKEKEHGKN